MKIYDYVYCHDCEKLLFKGEYIEASTIKCGDHRITCGQKLYFEQAFEEANKILDKNDIDDIIKKMVLDNVLPPDLSHDLTAYNFDGDKAVIIYDKDDIGKVFYLVCLVKENFEWKYSGLTTLKNQDDIDAMLEVDAFLRNEYKNDNK